MKTLKILILAIIFISITGCFKNYYDDYDNTPPNPPRGVYSINGDEWVDIFWKANNEPNIDAYNIYVSSSYNGKYERIGTTTKTYFTDYGVKNGVTYYYAVAAVNYNGYESDLSLEEVKNTPRPEGKNQAIFDFRKFPNTSGYDFSTYSVKAYNDKSTDMFFDNDSSYYYMVVWDDTDIQDMGPTTDIYDIPYAPTKGWSTTKDVQVKIGNTYVVWTWDNHFAKFRVKNITNERIVFDWAYQLQEGNTQLKRSVNLSGERKPLNIAEMSSRLNRIR